MTTRPDYHKDSPVTFRPPAVLLVRLDNLAGSRGESRSAAIIRAITELCDREMAHWKETGDPPRTL